MEAIKEFFEFDYSTIILSICTILLATKFIISLFEWFFNKFGIETKWMRKKRENENLLLQTSKKCMDLQKKHDEQVARSLDRDEQLKNDLNAFAKEMRECIKNSQDQINQFADNRVHDRQQSFAIQKQLVDAQNDLAKSVDSVSNKIDKMKEETDERFIKSEMKTNRRIRAELKDKIGRSYRYYHNLGEITDMELEALEDLIAEYEAADGENSFVHSIVQKEMYTWKRINDRMQ